MSTVARLHVWAVGDARMAELVRVLADHLEGATVAPDAQPDGSWLLTLTGTTAHTLRWAEHFARHLNFAVLAADDAPGAQAAGHA